MNTRHSRVLPRTRRVGFLLLLCGQLFAWRASAVGTWAPLTSNPPGDVQMMLLLPDGTVMAQNAQGNAWYRLQPDTHGSYVNGTWTTLAPMSSTRLYYSSAVLQNGRVFVAGAEYGSGSATAEVYDPPSNSWTPVPVPAGLLNMTNAPAPTGQNTIGFSDSGCKLLPNGSVMIAPVYPLVNNGTLIYNPSTGAITAGPPALRSQNEASWVKLPDDSILTVDSRSTRSERYIPSLNAWINDANVPVALYDNFAELGAAVLLADGRAFFLGGTGTTAFYTPSGTTAPGTWAAGPNIPAGLAAPDAPAAVMVNGKILCAFSPPLYQTNITTNVFTIFPPPTSFFEFDPVANAFTPAPGPTGLTDNIPAYQTIMLDLPDGTVLYSHWTNRLFVYTPDGSPLAAGKPAITGVSANGNGSFHLTGTGLNGISEGAAYGDDAQMDSNFPLVRVNDGNGNVVYLPTFNWSSTGVRTGNTPVSTEFSALTSLTPGLAYSLVAVANGNSSDPVTFFGPVWADFNGVIPVQIGSFDLPYHTLGQAVSAVPSTGTIKVKTPGHTPETMTISKPMTIVAADGPVTIGQ